MPPRSADDQFANGILDHLLGYRLKRAYMRLQPAAQAALAEEGLRVLSFSTLALICANPGIVQASLAAALQMERSNLVPILDDLNSRGLILRQKVEGDRRRLAIHATPEGEALHRRAEARVKYSEDALLANLSQSQIDALFAALSALEAKV